MTSGPFALNEVVLCCRVLSLLPIWLGFSGYAAATSCIEPPRLTLEEAYEEADAIVMMQATGCEGSDLAQAQLCSSNQYTLSVTEVLKEASPARDYSGVFGSAGPMGCGHSFSVGQVYLLYLDEENRPIYGIGGSSIGRIENQLGILREYRDGRVDDLSGPWEFMDTGIQCRIAHSAKDLNIGIEFFYGKPQPGIRITAVTTVDGRLRFRATPGTSLGQTSSRREGPDVSSGSVVFRFRVGDGKTPLEPGSVAIGNRTWELHPESVYLEISGGLVSTYSLIAVNGDATAMLKALSEPGKVVANVVRAIPPVTFDPPGEQGTRSIQLETRTTQFAKSARDLMGCIDGSTRNPEPTLN